MSDMATIYQPERHHLSKTEEVRLLKISSPDQFKKEDRKSINERSFTLHLPCSPHFIDRMEFSRI